MKNQKKKFIEGKKYFVFMITQGRECLSYGPLFACKECGIPSQINGVWCVGNIPSGAESCANEFKESYGDITAVNSIGENCYCEDCYCTADIEEGA